MSERMSLVASHTPASGRAACALTRRVRTCFLHDGGLRLRERGSFVAATAWTLISHCRELSPFTPRVHGGTGR